MSQKIIICLMVINFSMPLNGGSNLSKSRNKYEFRTAHNGNNNNRHASTAVTYLDIVSREINNKILLLAKIQTLKKNIAIKNKFRISNDPHCLFRVQLEMKEYPFKRVLTLPKYFQLLDFNLKNNKIISLVRGPEDKQRYPEEQWGSMINPVIDSLTSYTTKLISLSKFGYSLNITSGSHNETIQINNESAEKLCDFTINAAGTIIYMLEDTNLVIRKKNNNEWRKYNTIQLNKSYKQIGYLDEFKAVVLFDNLGQIDLYYLKQPNFSKNLMKVYLNQN